MKCDNVILLLLIIFLLVLVLYISNNRIEYFKQDKEVCMYSYNNKEFKSRIKIINGLVDKDKCDMIIDEGLVYSKKFKWKKNRHSDYPTTDNEITNEWKTYEYIDKLIKSKVFSNISKIFEVDKSKLNVVEYFIVKYEKNGNEQKELKKHTDGYEFSFIIALNDINEYVGGGTYFYINDKLVKLNKGDCVIFCGQNEHEGVKITDGVRYILTGFISYKNDSYCENIINDED